ncbi:leukosialin [Mustela putorius furo]|uniref:Leukosialin n=1 Tax=Mustela putorius furo TaxID=9669 RepID=A0A8U0UU89_MUSPF|nr:leukosialin [Mustela putorius furo]
MEASSRQLWEHRGRGRMLGWGGWSRGHFLSPWGPSAQSCSCFRRSWSWPGPSLVPSLSELLARRQCPLLPVPAAMRVSLFLLLLGGFWTQEVIPEPQDITATSKEPVLGGSSVSPASTFFEAQNLDLATPSPVTTKVPEEGNSTGHQVSSPSSDLRTTKEGSFPEASTAATSDLHVSDPTTSWKVSTQESTSLEINATGNPAETPRNSLALHVVTDGTVTPGSLETSDGAGGPPVTMATSSLETFDVTGGPPVTMATGSLETFDVTGGPPVTIATGTLETFDVTGGPPVTMATGSLETFDVTGGPPVTIATGTLETFDVTGGPPVTIATGTLETFDVTNGPPVTMATGSPRIPKETHSSPISTVEILAATTSASLKDTRSTQLPGQGTKGTLLVAVLVALLVVLVLVALLLLWRQRQKRRTGALTLSGGGKRNGVVDAWAGPAPAPDEEALTVGPTGGSGGEKSLGASVGAGGGRQPTLTTFFDRRKSQQGCLELGELKAGSGPRLQGEEEPLVGRNDDEAAEGPGAGGAAAPQGL